MARELTDSTIKAAKPQQKAYKLRDGDGLHVLITPKGKRLWRLRFGHGPTESMISLGRYPDVSLARAREKADEYRKQHADGITPTSAKMAERAAKANTFKAVALEWLEHKRGAVAPITRAKDEWILNDLLFPHIGSKPVAQLTAAEILTALRRIEARGKIETAHRAKQRVSQVMRYAIATGRIKSDPARDLRDALKPLVVKHHASIKDEPGIGALLRAINGYDGDPTTHTALKLAPLVFLRPGELRAAEWSEFTLDGDEPIWRIPGKRMKRRRHTEEGFDHIVPLSKQAVAILRELQPLTGRGRLVFPSVRTRERPISDNTLNAALRRLGYTSEQMTAHGFRSIASTKLNEYKDKQRFHVDWIERQLAHVEGNNVRAAYNAAEYISGRRRMMQWWANYLDGLKAIDGGKVVSLRRGA